LKGASTGSRKEDEAMMLSDRDIVTLLRAKPGRFVEDIAGDEKEQNALDSTSGAA
jgi:hypothetical protein